LAGYNFTQFNKGKFNVATDTTIEININLDTRRTLKTEINIGYDTLRVLETMYILLEYDTARFLSSPISKEYDLLRNLLEELIKDYDTSRLLEIIVEIDYDTNRFIVYKKTDEYDTKRKLLSLKTFDYDTLRILNTLIELSFDTSRLLGFEMDPVIFDTLRLLHKFKNLQWSQNRYKELGFLPNYWNFTEHLFEQFKEGDHLATNAYNLLGDFIGMAEDYHFVWGPEEEGQPLHEEDYGGGAEYTDRLWGVYKATDGEIYLVKANEDLTAWERHEQLTFAPTGSQYPTIAFREDGRYEIAVEFTPAGQEEEEVWIMEYPYETGGTDIRRVSLGRRPYIFAGFNGDVLLFYTDLAGEVIHYRSIDDDYNTEYTIDDVYIPERELSFRHTYKGFKPHESGNPNTEEYYGHYVLFYERADDWQPLKYIYTDVIATFPPVVEGPVEDYYSVSQVNLSGISWTEIREFVANGTENYDVDNVSLDNILFQIISDLNTNQVENYEVDNINLDNIVFQVISDKVAEGQENYNVNDVSLINILWVEV